MIINKKVLKPFFAAARQTSYTGIRTSVALLGERQITFQGWCVSAERVYNMARGGPMAAWNYVYTLHRPDGFRFQLGTGQESAMAATVRIIARESAAKATTGEWPNHYPKDHIMNRLPR